MNGFFLTRLIYKTGERRQLPHDAEDTMHLLFIAAASAGAIISTIFSLTHNIFEVFPFLYILPIILAVYFYPKKAVIFSLLLSIIYIFFIYLFELQNPYHIAIATAWFAIFITISVVTSSYANRLAEEKNRIRQIFHNAQDGILCIDLPSLQIRDINPKCLSLLKYKRDELAGMALSLIWPKSPDRDTFFANILLQKTGVTSEGVFTCRDGSAVRLLLSSLIVTKEYVLCSAIDLTDSRIADEEIRRTLEDLEKQVRERTLHLEKMNTELRAQVSAQRQHRDSILHDPGDEK